MLLGEKTDGTALRTGALINWQNYGETLEHVKSETFGNSEFGIKQAIEKKDDTVVLQRLLELASLVLIDLNIIRSGSFPVEPVETPDNKIITEDLITPLLKKKVEMEQGNTESLTRLLDNVLLVNPAEFVRERYRDPLFVKLEDDLLALPLVDNVSQWRYYFRMSAARGAYVAYMVTYANDYCSGINGGVPGVAEGKTFIAKFAKVIENGLGDLPRERSQMLIPYAVVIPQVDLTNYTKLQGKLYVQKCGS